MATTNMQIASTPGATDYPFQNYSTSTDIAAGVLVSIDTTSTSLLNNSASTPQTGIGVVISPAGANPPVSIGVALDTIKAGGSGRVRCFGPIVPAVADGAITAGTAVDASASTAGKVKTHTAAKNAIGVALATAADGDTIPVMLAFASNA